MTDKILFVDDEPETLQSYQRILRGKYQVETASSGEEALDSVVNRGPYAVVVSDVQMPGMDGVRFFSHLRQSAPNTVRVMLTGQYDLDTVVHAVNEGHIFHFLSKPCPPQLLEEALREAIAHHRGRKEKRIELVLPLLLYHGGDGERSESIRTIDISNSGARIAGFQQPLQSGEMIVLQYGDRKAAFQVIWAGCKEHEREAGVRCLTQDCKIWGQNLAPGDGERLRRDMAVARSVQSRLLPRHLPPMRTLDYSAHCIEARTIGGDYYDFIELGPQRMVFVLADIAGKGISAAILMANLHGIIRSQFNAGLDDLTRALVYANRLFYRHTESHRYATLFLACYDDKSRRLRYINCGHNSPLLLRGDRTERLAATATVLGLFQNWECSTAEVALETDDLLCIYTDGITEAAAKNGEEFGEARLLDLLQQNRNLEASTIIHRIEQAVHDFSSGDLTDDLTLVIARVQ